MARTRGKSNQTPPTTTPASTPVESTNKTLKTDDSNQSSSISPDNVKTNANFYAQDSTKANHIVNGSAISKLENSFSSNSVTNNCAFQSAEEKMSHLPDLLSANNIANHSVKSNGHHVDIDASFSSNISVTNSFNIPSNRTLSANGVATSTHTNGYSSHDDMSCTTR